MRVRLLRILDTLGTVALVIALVLFAPIVYAWATKTDVGWALAEPWATVVPVTLGSTLLVGLAALVIAAVTRIRVPNGKR